MTPWAYSIRVANFFFTQLEKKCFGWFYSAETDEGPNNF